MPHTTSKLHKFRIGMSFQVAFLVVIAIAISIGYTLQRANDTLNRTNTALSVNAIRNNPIILQTAKDAATNATSKKIESTKQELESEIHGVRHEFHVHQDNANSFREKTIQFRHRVEKKLKDK